MAYSYSQPKSLQGTRGYTLVELVVVMVLLGIVAIFSFSYIAFGARIYQDTTGREQLVSQTRFAVTRLSQEIRNAMPRSLRVSDTDNHRCIEFMPIVSSSNYVQIPRPGPSSTDDFIGILPVRSSELLGNYLLVYATNPNFIYGTNNIRRKTIDTVVENSPESGLVTLDYADSPRFFPTNSPARRFYVTSNPVSWCYNETSGELERYSDYGLFGTQRSQAQLFSNGLANREVMAVGLANDINDIEQLPFRVFEATLQRSSLVQFDWRFQRSGSNEPLQILHEVHVPNVP